MPPRERFERWGKGDGVIHTPDRPFRYPRRSISEDDPTPRNELSKKAAISPTSATYTPHVSPQAIQSFPEQPASSNGEIKVLATGFQIISAAEDRWRIKILAGKFSSTIPFQGSQADVELMRTGLKLYFDPGPGTKNIHGEATLEEATVFVMRSITSAKVERAKKMKREWKKQGASDYTRTARSAFYFHKEAERKDVTTHKSGRPAQSEASLKIDVRQGSDLARLIEENWRKFLKMCFEREAKSESQS